MRQGDPVVAVSLIRAASVWAMGGVMRWVLRVLAAVVVLAVAGVAVLVYQWERHLTPPDVAATAGSAPVRQAAERAAGQLDARALEVLRPVPWLAPVSSGVEDVCQTEGGTFIGSGWGPVICSRTTWRVLGTEDADLDRRQEWDKALRADGWRDVSAPDGPSAVPVPRRNYRGTDGVAVAVTWVESPADLTKLAAPRPYPDSNLRVDRLYEPLDEAATRRAATRYRHLVVVTASVQYHGPDAAASPSPTVPQHGCRRTDSENCPGG